ncbi:MAG TPA: hypothetical protein VMH03_07860 [Terriglobales bacterium]|nr:hypothetical protein [Terriglobales bacterium]
MHATPYLSARGVERNAHDGIHVPVRELGGWDSKRFGGGGGALQLDGSRLNPDVAMKTRHQNESAP